MKKTKSKPEKLRYRIEYSDGLVEIMEGYDFYAMYVKFTSRAQKLRLSVMAERI